MGNRNRWANLLGSKGSLHALALCLSTLAAAFPTAAHADEYFAVTPSGATEALFPEPADAVVGKLSAACIDAKMRVMSSSVTELVCEAPLNTGQSIMGQLLMGNSYSTPPRRFYRFNVASINGVSRVQASGWMELQMAFGQMKRTDFSGPEFHNSLTGFLTGAGGKLPQGTTFPNHAVMGFDADDRVVDGYLAMTITKIETGSAAERAGLQTGDVVTRIAGKRFKNFDDYLDATAKAASKPTYEVEYQRSGQARKVTLDRAFRPTVTEQVVATPVAPAAPVMSANANLSVADELEKLAALRDKGILSADEFEAQKKKLLSAGDQK